MTALLLSEQAFRRAKSHLHEIFPEIKSSHLAEALAASLGFNTHAALLQHMKQSAPDPDIRVLDPVVFEQRVAALGYNIYWDGSAETEFVGFEDGEVAFATSSYDFDESKALSKRRRAWQNLMIAGINAGLRQKIFGLRVDDNRWPGYVPHSHDGVSDCVYHFQLDGLPASAYVHDISSGELEFHVVLQPTGEFMSSMNAGFSSGEASAGGWLERRNGIWIQDSATMFKCRRPLIDILVNLTMPPMGYGRKGKFYR